MASSVPGVPTCFPQGSTTVLLSWTIPTIKSKIDHFEIKYQMKGEKKWKAIETEKDEVTLQVTDLKSDSTYVFKVRAVFDDGDESSFSGQSKPIKTLVSLSKEVKKYSTRLAAAYPQTYKLPISNVYVNKDAMARNGVVLCEKFKKVPGKQDKTIMVLGATGAGKSTLIDGMCNYILDVAWEDDTRFKIIDLTGDEKERHKDQSKSQTEWITCYRLNWKTGCQFDYNLNIIDTPGFGDTRGIARDRELVSQIRTFFTSTGNQGVAELDAVCFVTQAPLCRLTATQRYIFDSILALFGNDIKRNIFVLITFADGDQPPVLNTLKEAGIPFEKEFVFNNSALFVDPGKTKNGHMFWKMGKQSFDDFFTALRKTTTISLSLTAEVLITRRQLEVDIQSIQRQITEGMQRLGHIRAEEDVLDRHKQQIADNKDFEYTVMEMRTEEVPLTPGKHTTTCIPCNMTCHENCGIPDDGEKKNCWAMTGDNCRVCLNKCLWSLHKNRPYILKQKPTEVKKTHFEEQKRYKTALGKKDEKIDIIDSLKKEYNRLMDENRKLVNQVRELINRLQEIALKPMPMSELEYIDLLIEAENDKMDDGYKTRVEMYKELRKQAKSLRDIAENKFEKFNAL